jgi:hypothetical protein
MSFIGNIFRITVNLIDGNIHEVQKYVNEFVNIYADALVSDITTSGDKLSFSLGNPESTTLDSVVKMLGPIFPIKLTTIDLKTKGFIEAAVDGQEKYAGKTYFFKGAQFIGKEFIGN